MRVVVTGRSGQVATALREVGASRGVEVVTVGRPEMDLSDKATFARHLEASAPDVIVSAAAYTAVDRAETEAELAQNINGDAPGEIATVAARIGVPLIHLSTDYVFSGAKAGRYDEDDETGPLGVYGRSKLAGEEGVRRWAPNHAILRTAWVYSPFGHNFLKTMLRLAETRPELRVVADQRGSPTSALDIANAVFDIAEAMLAKPDDAALRGTFHLTGSGEASWAEFAEEIFRISRELGGASAKVLPIPASEYPTPAARPANSRLNTQKLADAYGLILPDWRASTAGIVRRVLGAGEPKHNGSEDK